jgi:hypothetical protein
LQRVFYFCWQHFASEILPGIDPGFCLESPFHSLPCLVNSGINAEGYVAIISNAPPKGLAVGLSTINPYFFVN